MKQMTRKVAFLLAGQFEDSEMKNPYEAITKNGDEAVIIGLKKGEELTGKQGTITYKTHLSIEEAKPDDYVAVIIPGGKSPSQLRESKPILDFVRQMDAAGKPISAICHGPQILASAGLLKGRTLTGYPEIEGEIREAGGEFVDREVVVDRNLVTSRSPEDEPAFIQETIDKLGVSAY